MPGKGTNRSKLAELLVAYNFKVVCSACSVKENEITYSLKAVEHQCSRELLLAKGKGTSKWRPVSCRPKFTNPSQYNVCWYFVEGSGCSKHRNRCTFARSLEEATMWNFLKHQKIDHSTLIRLITQSERIAVQQQNPAEKIITEFSGEFQELCQDCFCGTPTKITGKRWNNTCSADTAHVWSPVLVHHLAENQGKEVYNQIRPLPPVFPFQYCNYFMQGMPCWHGPSQCQLLHSEVELAVWRAEAHGEWSRQELLQLSQERQWQRQQSAQDVVPAPNLQAAIYCKACFIALSSQESFFKHCASLGHSQMISGDTTTEWKHRPPPHSHKAEFWFCDRPDTCEYGTNCVKAHSVEELEEWLMRAEEDKVMRRNIKAQGLMSYREHLLEEYRQSSNEVQIISEQVDDVSVTFDGNLCVECVETDAELKWNFQIKTERLLAHVALLKQEPGASFSLDENSPEPCTYTTGEQLCNSDMTYDITVSFKSNNPGLYEQWLVFDFDMRPVLLQKLKVKVRQQPSPNLEEPPEDFGRPFQNLEHWHRGNRVIIPCMDKTEVQEELLKEYKPPQISLQYKPLDDSNTAMNHQNYKKKMHSFLYTEEQAEDQIVSRLNVRGTITLSVTLDDPQFGMKMAPLGELFCAVSVPYTLTPDSPEGWVLRRSVQSALIAPVSLDNQSHKVYEAIILRDASSENKMHLQLSKRCCSDLKLQRNETYEMEVQFHLNRLKFCEMHKAIDFLPDTERVLPDFRNCIVPVNEIEFPKVNAKQHAAIDFIVGDSDGRSVAPLLIYGPFGTGKTFTLAAAAKELVRQPHTRVLICTLTNSSADLYIKDHFHPYVNSGHPEMKPLRIKANKQGVLVSSTDEITQKYCLLSKDGQFFLPPTKSALDHHRIVITTTAMARHFNDLKLSDGYFTHILIDEASQMLECEALMPLGLAGPVTRVVLAGDHMQMGPKLFSTDDDQHSNHSLLNRLFHFYQGCESSTALKSRIFFHENYRNTKEIVEFVSTHFYVGKSDVIKAVGNVPAHPNSHPLRFHHVRGESHLDTASMSWFNLDEVECVVEIVQNLLRDWPIAWGNHDQSSICVLSERCQVSMIRKELQKRFLGRVTVENISNVQGKQFRAIVMTAVQTRDSLHAPDSYCVEFFNDARMLNTAMTRAQSQVVVVGDAAALCYFGKCSRIWRSYIHHCISKGSAEPKHLTNDFIDGDIKEISRFQRTEYLDEGSTQSVMFDTENNIDAILQELQEEQNREHYTLLERKRLYDSAKVERDALLQLLREQPNVYKRGELVMEKHNAGYIIPFDNPTNHIIIKGRGNLGKSFCGDEVVAEVVPCEGIPQGKVLGTIKAAESHRVFACTLEVEDYHKPKTKTEYQFLRKIMVPLNTNTTKICTLVSKKSHNLIPIWKHNDGEWEIVRYQQLDEEIKCNHVFMVEVFCWKTKTENKGNYAYPLGKVIDILSIGSSLEEGLRILDAEFNVQPLPPSHVLAEPCSWKDTQNSNRKDLRKFITFTVDQNKSLDLDDAISVIDMESHYEVGVHIADVASFVNLGGSLDDAAQKHGATFYSPREEPVCMFPKSVSIYHFSLLPGIDRKVVSLMVKVDKATHKITEKKFQLSQIKSDRKLSYDEAEDIISKRSGEEAKFDTLEDCVSVAYRFAKVQRKARLGKDWSYRQLDDHQKPGKRRSSQMIEELSVLFNHSVSEFLINANETMFCTPLRCQVSPDPEMLEDLKEQYKDIIPLSLHLRHNLEHDIQLDQEAMESKSFYVLTSIWNEILSAAKKEEVDTDTMIDLIGTDDIYPLLLPVIYEFRKCLDEAYVIRSNSSQEKVGHYSLKLESYTQASSPIRRYMDIILQRLLHSVLSGTPVQYSPQEIDILCQKIEDSYKKANEYEKKAAMISFAINMKKQNFLKLAFVVGVAAGDSFKLSFPFDRHSFPEGLPVRYRDLQPKDQPLYDSNENQMTLTWRRRVYSIDTAKIHEELKKVQNSAACIKLPQKTWQAIVNAMGHEKWNIARSLILDATTKQTENVKSLSKHAKVDLLEAGNDSHRTAHGQAEKIEIEHYVDLTLHLKPGDTLQVQMTSEGKKGYWTPTVQLVCIKPIFELCVNHAHSPITCFSKRADCPSKSEYSSAREYVKIWRPLCEMESADNAVDESDSIIIEDLKLNLKQGKNRLKGSFELPLKYIKEWAIECNLSKCFLCIRKRGLKLTSIPDQSEEVVDPKNYTWVAHGVTTNFEEPKNNQNQARKVHFYINHLPMDTIPECVYQRKTTYTVEIIPKLLTDVRKEMAVNNIVSANELVQKIALGQHIPKGASQSVVPPRYQLMREKAPEGLPELNKSQIDAVEKALNNNFTIIQGPPGTGKTVLGVYIVYWFLVMNSKNPRIFENPKDKDKKEVILCCGPSNKSVDVVAECLVKFGDKLKPLRVYSRQLEMAEYPYPGSVLQLSPRSLRHERSKAELRDITLHHRIREEQNPHSTEIKEFDHRIKLAIESKGEELTAEEVEDYKCLLNKARVHELQRHDVILCTCTAASSPNLTKTVSARQILIDECAMATEPQALIPLVSNKPEKIVLLGDHKQLRPIVKNELLRKLGMSKSLFERYFEYRSQTVMLDTQYRMHEDICKFPSEEYYGGKLKTEVSHSSSVLEADSQQKHIVFGNVIGEEVSLVVSTEKGTENSKANRAEREVVIRLAKALVTESQIEQQNIAILSPYNAQVSEFKKELHEHKMDKITVTTITKSQGCEWRYVILSTVRSLLSKDIEIEPDRAWRSKHVGFVGDPNQINVGITRAKEGLCIIGNQELLSRSGAWRQLLKHYRARNFVTEADKISVRKASCKHGLH
ncbi:helicase with zinc finger domain 2 isoform X1 [Oncorhynchus mykiss]|uniref:C3H1-type domain-containing protein n=2 Tax=Oncorhynchus mykiss TaxID=8022 RepID=A0A8C7U8M1_ONCMY|nr:helicase with zinc finger domain 2 isoform X1 [Oncorhynchus mykiss]